MRVEIRGLTVRFGAHAALRELDLDLFGDGAQVVALIGPSGSGKSTLIRTLKGLVRPTAGEVRLDGRPLGEGRSLREAQRATGMVFQQFQLVARLTALENVLLGRLTHLSPWRGLLRRFGPKDLELALELLARVDLLEHAWKRADTLSGGQQQRVGIARALMQEPELLLADEPVSALDPATSHSVMQYIEQINKEDGVTVIASLHFLSLARRYGQRIIALRAGEIVFDGLPEAIDDRKFKEIYGEEAEEVEVR